MHDIQQIVLNFLPLRRKNTPSGWISFDSVCCHHRGESKDTKQRGGLRLTEQNGWTYHCFNCSFKAGWSEGKLLSKNTKQFLKWLGIPDTEIDQLAFAALKNKQDRPTNSKVLNSIIEEKPLPENCKPVDLWITQGANDPELLETIKYLVDERKMNWDWYPWHWCSEPGYRDRAILPFYYENKIIGWTARKITNGKPKYLTNSQPGYVFNIDKQRTWSKKYLIVVEGPFDAIAIDGAAILHNDPNEQQAIKINQLNKDVIVVPDRDRAGTKMIEQALKYNWAVSLPPWEDDIKDVADAVKKYGRLYTLLTIINFKETNKIKIQLLQKKLENL